MLKQRADSINRSFRHQQSENLSHAFEPCELPIQKSGSNGTTARPVISRQAVEVPALPLRRTRPAGDVSLNAQPATLPKKQSGSDALSLYVSEALQTPLLSKLEEQQLAKQIFLYRQSFQRLILKEPAVVQHFIGLLDDLSTKAVRLDSICNFGLSETEKRERVEPNIGPGLKTLKRIYEQIRQPTCPVKTGKRQHRVTIQLVENLMIRPNHFESAPFENARAARLLETYRRLGQQMVQANLRLVVLVARQTCGSSPLLMDMIQEGNRGLMHAVTKFDHQCNVRFSTYATPWIKQAIFAALPNAHRNIRVPENFRSISRRVKNQVRQLRTGNFEFRHADSGQAISLIAEGLEMQPADVASHLRTQRDTCSLDQPADGKANGSDQPSSLADLLSDRGRTNPMRIAQLNERKKFVRTIMAQSLTRREHDVISLRFGFGDGKNRSFAEVGRKMGLTRQRVCQVEKQALAKLGKITERMEYSCI